MKKKYISLLSENHIEELKNQQTTEPLIQQNSDLDDDNSSLYDNENETENHSVLYFIGLIAFSVIILVLSMELAKTAVSWLLKYLNSIF